MKKIFFIFIIVIILFGCSSKSEDKLIVGIIKPSLNHLPFDFGLEIGTLNRSDYIIKKFSSGWETNEALISGKIDVAIMPFTYVWTGVSKGKKVKIISFFERESDGIIAKKEIKTLEDLQGKKIGVLRASTLDIFAEICAEDHNIDFEMIYFRTPMDMASALRSGRIDALSFYVPPIFKFDEEFHIIHWYSEDYPFHTCCDIAATETAIQKKLPKIKKFLKGLEKSTDEMNNSPQVAYEAARTFFDLYLRDAKKSLYHTKFVMEFTDVQKKFEQKVIKKMIEKGYIENEVNPDDVYFEVK
ncbi:MAG: ABC transporter substrate-binding protein [Candidatus Cloacimonetes bacterium]|nr:ABC transporter substrate-binding protein [Candidatus Cloacimonadota bacterium]